VELLTGPREGGLPPPFRPSQPDRTPMRALILTLAACLALGLSTPVRAQDGQSAGDILTANRALVEKASRQTIGPVIDALAGSDDPAAARVLSAWADKGLGIHAPDGAFVLIEK